MHTDMAARHATLVTILLFHTAANRKLPVMLTIRINSIHKNDASFDLQLASFIARFK